MPHESQIPITSSHQSQRFATRLALFYGAIFALIGCHLPFFPVWLRAVGIDAGWIGGISAVPAASWTPTVPLTDAYALRGVARYGLDYGPLRLWGSAAFIVGALGCGLLAGM